MMQSVSFAQPPVAHILLVAVHYMTNSDGASSSFSVVLLLLVIVVRLFFVPTFSK